MAFQVFYSYLISQMDCFVALFFSLVLNLAGFLRTRLPAAFTSDWWCCCFIQVLADVASRSISGVKLLFPEVRS